MKIRNFFSRNKIKENVNSGFLNSGEIITKSNDSNPVSDALDELIELNIKDAEKKFTIMLLSNQTLNTAEMLKRRDETCVLLHALRYQSEVINLEIINKLNMEIVNQFASAKYKCGRTFLMCAMEKQSEAVCLSLVKKLDTQTLNRVADLQDDFGRTFLMCAMEKQSEAVCLSLVQKLDTQILNRHADLKDCYDCTFLMHAMQYQSEAVCLSLVQKLDTHTLNRDAGLKDFFGCTFLMHAMKNQSEAVCLSLIKKLNAQSLIQQLTLKNNEGDTMLMLATSCGKIFKNLLNNLDSTSLKLTFYLRNNAGKNLYDILNLKTNLPVNCLGDYLRKLSFYEKKHQKILGNVQIKSSLSYPDKVKKYLSESQITRTVLLLFQGQRTNPIFWHFNTELCQKIAVETRDEFICSKEEALQIARQVK